MRIAYDMSITKQSTNLIWYRICHAWWRAVSTGHRVRPHGDRGEEKQSHEGSHLGYWAATDTTVTGLNVSLLVF